MKVSARRFIVASCLACGIAMASLAAPAPWPGGVGAGLAACAAMLPPFALVALLWRWRRRDAGAPGLRQQLAAERALRAAAEQALREAQARLAQLEARQDGIKEEERRRIGRDIHDDLGQNLLALKIDISMLHAGSAALHPQLQQKLGAIAANIDLTIRSLRCIINDLRPTALEAGLKTAVDRQLSEFSRISGVACRLEAHEGAFDGAAAAALDAMVLRVLQEALSNIARHARASAVTVALLRDGAGLTMTVSDNGVGMPDGQAPRGCGLLGIKDRVAAAGGRLAIDSRPGQGTALSLSVPLAEALPVC